MSTVSNSSVMTDTLHFWLLPSPPHLPLGLAPAVLFGLALTCVALGAFGFTVLCCAENYHRWLHMYFHHNYRKRRDLERASREQSHGGPEMEQTAAQLTNDRRPQPDAAAAMLRHHQHLSLQPPSTADEADPADEEPHADDPPPSFTELAALVPSDPSWPKTSRRRRPFRETVVIAVPFWRSTRARKLTRRQTRSESVEGTPADAHFTSRGHRLGRAASDQDDGEVDGDRALARPPDGPARRPSSSSSLDSTLRPHPIFAASHPVLGIVTPAPDDPLSSIRRPPPPRVPPPYGLRGVLRRLHMDVEPLPGRRPSALPPRVAQGVGSAWPRVVPLE